MAGLLDFFGKSWDDPKSNAVMALAGGLLDGDAAAGMKGYAQVMAGAGEAKFKKQLQQAQMDKYAADTDLDKQKLSLNKGKDKRDSDFESMLINAIKQRQTGGVAVPHMPVTGSPPLMGGGDPFAGVDPMAMMLDYRNNGGKKMGDWVNDRTAPKWENVNGNMVNTNAPNFSGGFQAGMKASDNGQMSMWQPDGQGGLVVGAPRGALETYSAYRNADEAAKARTATTDYTPPGGLPVRMTKARELELLNGGQPTQATPMTVKPTGNQSWISPETKSGQIDIYESELRKAQVALSNPNLQPLDRERLTKDVAGIQREMARAGGRTQSLTQNQSPQSSFGLPLQSQQEKDRIAAESKAYETKLVETAKADVTRDSAKATERKQYNQFSTGIDRAIDLLKQNPTASGVGALTDSGLGFIGQSTKSGDTANQLTALSGWLIANVPRMEGPQSNFDVDNYKIMAGAVGDRTKPISTRLAAAEEVKKLQEKYAAINRGVESKKPEAKNIVDTMPAANTGNRGQRIRDTTTGKILKSNGMSWVAE